MVEKTDMIKDMVKDRLEDISTEIKKVTGDVQGRIKDIQDRMGTLEHLTEDVRKSVNTFQDKVKDYGEKVVSTRGDSVKKVEEVLGSLKIDALLDKLNNLPLVEQGMAVRDDVMGRLGFASKEEYQSLVDTIASLEKKVAKLDKEMVSKKDLDKLAKKIDKLEKASKKAPAKKTKKAKDED